MHRVHVVLGAQRHRAATALLLALCLVTLAVVPAALGQDDPEPSEAQPTRLTVARLTSVVGPGSVPANVTPPEDVLVRVLVEHLGPADLVDAEVVVESYARLSGRGLLRQALDGGELTGLRRVHRKVVREGAPIEAGDIAAVDFFLPVDELTQSGASGVYPVQISLTRGTDVLDRVVTAVVNLEEPPANPLATVAAWPVDLPPLATPELGTADLDDQIRAGGRLDDLVAGLEVGARSGIVPAVSAHLLDALVTRAGPLADEDAITDAEAVAASSAEQVRAGMFLDRVRRTLQTSTMAPVAGPYAEADLSVLVDAGAVLATVGGDLAVDGIRRIAGNVGRDPDSSALLATAPLTTRALDLLPSDHLLLPWKAVSATDPSTEQALPPVLRELRTTTGRVLTASVADPWLAGAMSAADLQHGTVVAVQRVLAETAMIHFEAPGVADRPLLLLPDRDWAPTGRLSRDLAAAIVAAPWLGLSSPATHAALVQETEVTTLAARNDRVQPALATDINEALTALEGIRGSLPDGTNAIAGRRLDALELQLRRATSHWFADDVTTAVAMVEDVMATIDTAYGVVDIPTATGVTLAGEKQPIPITIGRPSGDDILVDVELRSGGGLSWPNGDTQEDLLLVAGGRQTLTFDVEARARGDIRVEVIVRDASGARILADETIRVRSTLISRTALVIVAGMVLVLLLIGRLRRRPQPPEDPDEPSSPDDPTRPGESFTMVSRQ